MKCNKIEDKKIIPVQGQEGVGVRLTTEDKLKKLVVAEDAREVFGAFIKIDPDFEKFVDSFYSDFSTCGVTPELIDKYGQISIQSGIEVKKIARMVLTTKDPGVIANLVLNAMVLIYGYSSMFNQAIDDGIIERGFNDKLEIFAKSRKVDDMSIFSVLDALEYSSFLTKRYFKTIEIVRDERIMGMLSKLLSIESLMDDSKMRENAELLTQLYVEAKLDTNRVFLEYFRLFQMDYFPLLAMAKLIDQVQRQGKPRNKPKKERNASVLDNFENEANLYLKLKRWKDISGIASNANQLRLYFEVLSTFAAMYDMELYSPISEFIESAKVANVKFKKEYDLGDLDGARMVLSAWDNILD